MRLIKGSLAGLVLTGILAMMPAAAFAHGGGWWGRRRSRIWREEVEDTLLSVVVMHLADSPGVASVRDSGGCEAFPPVDFLVAEMMAVSGRADAVVIPHSTMVASITAFLHTTLSFDATTASSPISRSSGLASLTGTQTTMTRIPTTTQTMTANRVTMTNILTSRPCRRHRNSPDVPTTPHRLRESVASALPCRGIK